jgi:hypothetical protein
MCVKCHSSDTDRTLKAHQMQIARIGKCLSCHEPHVTKEPGLLKPIKHEPFARKDCLECHE